MTAFDRWLGGRAAPWLCAAITAACVLVTWGSFSPWPLMHDEWAYWMQGQQYAALHWFAPAPPIPEFFEQLYVLVTPVWAAKYWPGHAIAIAPGFAFGAPWVMPVALSAASGALVFTLARRVAGARVAALTFVLWIGTFDNLRFRATFFSETTTSCAWLVAWWALLRWRETKRGAWMALLAIATGWGAISRPATMLVFALPVGVIVIRDCLRGTSWRQLTLGVCCGTAVLLVLPLWNARVTNDREVTPLALYTRQYLPFDVPGYTVNQTPPQRALPPEMERVRGFLKQIKEEQAAAPAWRTFAERAGFLLRDMFAGWRAPFVVAFATGLVVAGAAGWFAIASSVLLLLAYITHAHTPDWTIYYLEAFPAVAFIAALGARRMAQVVRARNPRIRGSLSGAIVPLAVVAGAVLVTTDTLAARATLAKVAAHTTAFRSGVAALPAKPNIVFVRYAPQRNMHLALVANGGDLAASPSWIVHDRGDDDARLIAAAPDRTPYLFDESTGAFSEIRR